MVALQEKLGYIFTNPALLDQALKHRSYVYAVDEGSIASNERLEFLGDAVLDLIVTEDLYSRFRDKREASIRLWEIYRSISRRSSMSWPV